MISEPDSFAYRTMTTRKPRILRDVLDDYAGVYSTEIMVGVQALHDELVNNQPVQPLIDVNSPDAAAWYSAWRLYQGQCWLALPWFWAETFLYRRLMAAVGYFKDDEWGGIDPFLPRKQAELEGETAWQVLAGALAQSMEDSSDSLQGLLYYGVWGNRIDLSYRQVAQAAGGQIALDQEVGNLLVDDAAAVVTYLQTLTITRQHPADSHQSASDVRPPSFVARRVDFICDNAGAELLTDLVLVDFLLRFKWATEVVLHVKAHPTYVSDTIPADVDLTLAAMKEQEVDEFFELATRLERYLKQQRLRVRADFFWNSHRFFWEFPPPLQVELGSAHLIIIKGDANYRRLLGDHRWPTTMPMGEAAPYFPAPFVTLRTLKSDPIVGLQPGQAGRLDQEDAEWRVNGKRGMVQAVLSGI